MSELPVKAKEGASVSHECSRFTVAPSPLNGIKLELGIVLLIATTLYVVVEIALLTGWLQVIVLGDESGYALGSPEAPGLHATRA